MKKIIIIGLVLIVFVSLAYSQGNELPSSGIKNTSQTFKKLPPVLKKKTSEFFNSLLDSNVNEAYNNLMDGSPLARKTEELKSLIAQTHRAFEIYGLIRGYEPVNSEHITPSFIRVRHLGLHTRFPMRWIFTFYKSPDKGWIITNVKFDDLTEFYFSDE